MAPRDGDKRQARASVHREVRRGRIRPANEQPCVDCGHMYSDGERRHEFDHFMGYDAENHLMVQVVCTTCHAARELSRRIVGQRARRGVKWCTACKAEHPVTRFGSDASRRDGLMARCLESERKRKRERWARRRK